MNAISEIREILDEAPLVVFADGRGTCRTVSERDMEQIQEYLAEIEDYQIRMESDLNHLERQLDYEELAG